MNSQNNSTKLNEDLQKVMEKWNEKILSFLPESLDELAFQTGAIKRKRGIHSAPDLLKILFLYACSNISFRILAAVSCALGISDIYDTAWRKHFSKSADFLHEILHSMLSSFIPQAKISDYGKIKNVLLVDASIICQTGKEQKQQRIHTCYSLNENRICEVKVTDKHTAESLKHFSVKKNDLVMADTGYGTAQNYIYAQEKGADVILRITPKNFCLYDADGNKISLIQLLKDAEKNHQKIIDIFGFCKYKTKNGHVRFIAEKLPEEKAEQSRKRKKKTASRKQHQIAQDTLFCAGWIVVITSLGIEYCAEEILYLSWSQFIDLTDEKYLRYLSKRKRCRKNQNDEFHEEILSSLITV